MREEPMAASLELGAQLAIVVDLAVADQPQRAVGGTQRLMSAGDVDDREAPHPNCGWAVDVRAVVVRTTMNRDAPHLTERLRGRRAAVEVEDAVNAAHRCYPAGLLVACCDEGA